ncbi:MAG: 5'-nucleotidase C-terminal domain-containing protein [Bacteroidia bacterium]
MRYRFLALLTLASILNSCAVKHYNIVKTNRDEYAINDKVGVDSAMLTSYLPYKKALDEEMTKVIGYTDIAIVKRSALPESLLGNFFADAVLKQARKIQANIDFAIPSTTGGLRNDIPKGAITIADIFQLMPFENEAVVLSLKGRDVFELLKFIAVTGGQPVAGIKMNIRNSQPENVVINGKIFDIEKEYNVLTADFLASGGDDTKGFANPVARKNLGLKIRDALLKEVTETHLAGEKIKVKLDGRITKN